MKKATSNPRTIRFSPQDLFLIDLAARVQRRSFSSFVNVAATQAAATSKFRDGSTIGDHLEGLWDIDATERLKRLEAFDSTLLSYDEQVQLRGLEAEK